MVNTVEILLLDLVMAVLFSGIIIVREWISARVQKSIQRANDAKLESLKADFQRQIEEHKTQFNYWHAEKAAAIKEVFGCICELYANLKILEAVDNAPTWKEKREPAREMLKDTIITSSNDTVRKWMKLRLFFDDKDDLKLGEFQSKTNYLILLLFDPDVKQKKEQIEENRTQILIDLEMIIESLRKSFRDTLSCFAADDVAVPQGSEASLPRSP